MYMGQKKTEAEELCGQYQSTRYSGEGGFVIGMLADKTTVKGKSQEPLLPGLEYRFMGRWQTDPKYGKQFAFETATKAEPASRWGVVSYLEKFASNIGPVIAGQLYDAFGSDAVKILRTDPLRAADACPKLRIDAAKEAAQSLQGLARTEETRIALTELFAGRHFPSSLVQACIDKWSVNAPAIIKRDPFVLMTHGFSGAGFARCDRLYLDLGHPPHKMKRQVLAMWRAVEEDMSGSTWLPYTQAKAAVERAVSGGGEVDPWKAARIGCRARWLACRSTLHQDGDAWIYQYWISTHERAKNEACVAKLAAAMLADTDAHQWPSVAEIADISEHQREQLGQALQSRLCLLLGGPGVGKTHAAASVLRKLVEQFGAGQIAVAAPTGKAAARISEAMAERGLAGLTATTIHRLFGVSRGGLDGDGWSFVHDESLPLPFKFVVVDESSMIDCDLMASLMRAIGRGTHLLLIGDPGQLPPVQHGAPLRDLIEAGAPKAELVEVRRNSGDLVAACHAMRQGKAPYPSKSIEIESGRNWRHWEAAAAIDQLDSLRKLLQSPPQGIDPTWDVQVVCPLRESGTLSRDALNELIHGILNPATSAEQSKQRFRVGDKVICTKNQPMYLVEKAGDEPVTGEADSLAPWDAEPSPCDLVANGEIGRVEAVRGNKFWVRLPYPDRLIYVGGEDQFLFDLAYAITVHKAQGSQAKIVIVMIDSSQAANFVCSREWHYTAISRAQQLVLTIGKLSTLRKQCMAEPALSKRKTLLCEAMDEVAFEVFTPCTK